MKFMHRLFKMAIEINRFCQSSFSRWLPFRFQLKNIVMHGHQKRKMMTRTRLKNILYKAWKQDKIIYFEFLKD